LQRDHHHRPANLTLLALRHTQTEQEQYTSRQHAAEWTRHEAEQEKAKERAEKEARIARTIERDIERDA
jgi:hypothetical protein